MRDDDQSQLRQMRPPDIDSALDRIFADNPHILRQLQSSPNLVQTFVGLAMKGLNGSGNPSIIKRKVEERLQKG